MDVRERPSRDKRTTNRRFNIILKMLSRLFDSFQTLCNDDLRMTKAPSLKEEVAKPPA
jgi:hypothetical protein